MKLHQPVLFVGLGGTGCAVGVELERRLREDLCGADGAALIRARPHANLQRYQLPSCLQFVYADVNKSEMDRLPLRAVPSEEHLPAVGRTAHYVQDLVPSVNTYPEVATTLRQRAEPYVSSWLPPAQGEPKVAPLSRGAGQLPTVGRAALFETMRQGTEPATRDLREAIGRLATSGEDLTALGGDPPTAVDVFVAFSVAGGTGAGIFYDYLHLIGEVLQGQSNTMVGKIYPLVVMPSAFPLGMGGGRPAQLNAGRSLLDLFRLVDEQNAGDVNRHLRGDVPGGRLDLMDPDVMAVTYPGRPPFVLAPSTVQTAFLFSLPLGADRRDLHRSVVSLVMSLIGTQLTQGADSGQHQSFADSFINQGVDREIPAQNGIGNRGVSTAQVASMTVPLDDLADLVAGRLLSAAVMELATPGGGVPEENVAPINDFFARAGIQTAISRVPAPFVEPEPAVGAQKIAVALGDRGVAMNGSLRELQGRLAIEVPQTVDRFDPRGAAVGLLGLLDPFRVQRVLFGHPDLPREAERGGALGVMNRLRQPPPAMEGFNQLPPQVPAMKDKLTRKVKWQDADPVQAREAQDNWYRWRTRTIWAQAWDQQGPRWNKPMEQLQLRWRTFTEALLEHARADADRFRSRAEDLARARVGVSYLLPLGGGDMDQFYDRVVNTMIERRHAAGLLRPAATQAELFLSLVGPDRWQQTYKAASEGHPPRAVSALRESLKEEVRQFLQNPGANGEPPMLPSMAARLRAAAGMQDSDNIGSDDLQDFGFKLAGLVPAGFAPQGSGKMKILITYPAQAENEQIESYLKGRLNLPPRQEQVEWRAIGAESLSVVMFRYGMGVTEVEEVREVMRVWAQALAKERPEDFLKWRQRTGYDFGYLVTREEHRKEILHHLLCALWNGKVKVVEGEASSPSQISVGLGGDVVMYLPLQGLSRASSWANLVRAYELWALQDDSTVRRNFCESLMEEKPEGIDSTVRPPDPLYLTVVGMAEEQIKTLDDVVTKVPEATKPRARQMRQFWVETMPGARTFPFAGSASAGDLKAIEEEYAERHPGAM